MGKTPEQIEAALESVSSALLNVQAEIKMLKEEKEKADTPKQLKEIREALGKAETEKLELSKTIGELRTHLEKLAVPKPPEGKSPSPESAKKNILLDLLDELP